MHPLHTLLNSQPVQWKTLGEVAKIQRGASPRPIAQYITDDENGVPWIKIGDITTGTKYVRQTEQKITQEGAQKSRVLKKGDFIMSNSMSYGRPYILDIDGAIHDGWASISDFQGQLNPDFLYYYLSSNSVQRYWDSKINSGSVSNLNSDIIKTLTVPLPPLPLQARIVEILDNFTACNEQLTAALNKEHTLRKKQYAYYRDLLLSEAELSKVGFEWRALGEVARYSPNRIAADQLHAENYVGVDNLLQDRAGKTQSNHVPQSGNSTRFDAGDVLIGNIRPYLKKIWHADRTGGTNGDVLVLQPTTEQLSPRFLYQLLADDKFFDYNMKHAKGAKMPRGNKEAILQYTIPIPPLPHQQKIVEILDRFDTLTNSITQGLPREIELRRKQYEYYRELLLTFE